MSVLAIALGNPLRGDDGAGAAIARGLEALIPGLEVVEAQELLPEHAERVAHADGLLILDAALDGPPGEVRTAPVALRAGAAPLLHALLPGALLHLARALYGHAPPAALITITGGDFSFGERLSPAVEAALPAARALARDTARAFLSSPPAQP